MASKIPDSDEEHYDVFIVHSSENNALAKRINDGLMKQKLKTFAHYKEGGLFGIGKPIVEGIKDAVAKSRIVLVLLTPQAIKSNWVTLELLLSAEKSVGSGEMCIRLVLHDVTEEELKKEKLMDLETIP